MHAPPFIPRDEEEQAGVREESESRGPGPASRFGQERPAGLHGRSLPWSEAGSAGFWQAPLGRCAGLTPHVCAESEQPRPPGGQPGRSLSTSPRTPCPRGVTASKLGRSWQRAAWGVCPCQARGRPEAPTQPSGSQQGRPLGPAPSRACAVALDLCWSRVLAAGR